MFNTVSNNQNFLQFMWSENTEFPIELSHHIFSFLESRDLEACSVVSKKWSVLAEDNSLWKALTISDSSEKFEIEPDWKAYFKDLKKPNSYLQLISFLNRVLDNPSGSYHNIGPIWSDLSKEKPSEDTLSKIGDRNVCSALYMKVSGCTGEFRYIIMIKDPSDTSNFVIVEFGGRFDSKGNPRVPIEHYPDFFCYVYYPDGTSSKLIWENKIQINELVKLESYLKPKAH